MIGETFVIMQAIHPTAVIFKTSWLSKGVQWKDWLVKLHVWVGWVLTIWVGQVRWWDFVDNYRWFNNFSSASRERCRGLIHCGEEEYSSKVGCKIFICNIEESFNLWRLIMNQTFNLAWTPNLEKVHLVSLLECSIHVSSRAWKMKILNLKF